MQSFHKLLFKATDDTIKYVLGDANSRLIHDHIEKQSSFTREELTEQIELFYTFLERLIGFNGAKILKVISFQYLLEKLKFEYEEVDKYLTILDELYKLKFKFLTTFTKKKYPDWN